MKYDSIKDLSILTTIPESTLKKLADKISWCICNDVQETFLNRENICEIDLGFGFVNIFIDEDQIKYKFVPSSLLENALKKSLTEGYNTLVDTVEKTLTNKIINTYKDFI